MSLTEGHNICRSKYSCKVLQVQIKFDHMMMYAITLEVKVRGLVKVSCPASAPHYDTGIPFFYKTLFLIGEGFKLLSRLEFILNLSNLDASSFKDFGKLSNLTDDGRFWRQRRITNCSLRCLIRLLVGFSFQPPAVRE